jgi:hypothetical protein
MMERVVTSQFLKVRVPLSGGFALYLDMISPGKCPPILRNHDKRLPIMAVQGNCPPVAIPCAMKNLIVNHQGKRPLTKILYSQCPPIARNCTKGLSITTV